MTVRELIDLLETCDVNANVFVQEDNGLQWPLTLLDVYHVPAAPTRADDTACPTEVIIKG